MQRSAPNEEALQLGLATAEHGQLLGVGRQHAVHDGLQGGAVGDLRQAARLHQRLHAARALALRGHPIRVRKICAKPRASTSASTPPAPSPCMATLAGSQDMACKDDMHTLDATPLTCIFV